MKVFDEIVSREINGSVVLLAVDNVNGESYTLRSDSIIRTSISGLMGCKLSVNSIERREAFKNPEEMEEFRKDLSKRIQDTDELNNRYLK